VRFDSAMSAFKDHCRVQSSVAKVASQSSSVA